MQSDEPELRDAPSAVSVANSRFRVYNSFPVVPYCSLKFGLDEEVWRRRVTIPWDATSCVYYDVAKACG